MLVGLNVYEGLGIDDPEKAKWHDVIFRVRGRNLRGAIFGLATLPKVDFSFADLRGATLNSAQLQNSTLAGAQLQNAKLEDAQLQNASLEGAQLQGALLNNAHLQGALLDEAQLQGAELDGTQLQGASLISAQLQGALQLNTQLQGASMENAQLQGAFLSSVNFQGASLAASQLQATSFAKATLEATDLSDAYLWRANQPEASFVSAIRLSGRENWLPESPGKLWDAKSYEALRSMIDSFALGMYRGFALPQIQTLACSEANPCDPSVEAPQTRAWREILEASKVDDSAFASALVKTLKSLVCSGAEDAIFVVRGAGFQRRLKAAGPAALGLINDLTNKESQNCPVSASLTDTDRGKLLQIKQEAEQAIEQAERRSGFG
jgi:uncharacterized protein YjbI with pentapeptide repeats